MITEEEKAPWQACLLVMLAGSGIGWALIIATALRIAH